MSLRPDTRDVRHRRYDQDGQTEVVSIFEEAIVWLDGPPEDDGKADGGGLAESGKKSATKKSKKKCDEVSEDSDGGQNGNESEESEVDDGTLNLLELSLAEMKSLLLHLGIAEEKAQLYSSTFTSRSLNTTVALVALDWSLFPEVTPTAGDKTKLRSLAQLPNGGMDYIKDQRALKRKVAQAEKRSKSKSNKSGTHKADVEAELLRVQAAYASPHAACILCRRCAFVDHLAAPH